MKTKITKKNLPPGTYYDPELDKYADVDLFPEKTAKIKQILKEAPIPQELIDAMIANRPIKK